MSRPNVNPSPRTEHAVQLAPEARYLVAIVLWLVTACPVAAYVVLTLRHQPRTVGGQIVLVPLLLAMFFSLELVRRGRRPPAWMLLSVDVSAALLVLGLTRSMLF